MNNHTTDKPVALKINPRLNWNLEILVSEDEDKTGEPREGATSNKQTAGSQINRPLQLHVIQHWLNRCLVFLRIINYQLSWTQRKRRLKPNRR